MNIHLDFLKICAYVDYNLDFDLCWGLGDWEVDMAGKSSRGRNRKGAQNAPNATEQAVSNGHSKDNVNTVEESKAEANGIPTSAEIQDTKPEVKGSENASSENHAKQGQNFLMLVMV
ncbi:hypothetical protein L2E82_21919 [Cichorium intybus]|uniref:Uncharacterized protein n=1 Tax=Cichorium intybus TaxID=13427 RepID=A0ACB9DW87_CICIN|nr:hypothetical protein L2E82_21919 [Cichorium intybus]